MKIRGLSPNSSIFRPGAEDSYDVSTAMPFALITPQQLHFERMGIKIISLQDAIAFADDPKELPSEALNLFQTLGTVMVRDLQRSRQDVNDESVALNDLAFASANDILRDRLSSIHTYMQTPDQTGNRLTSMPFDISYYAERCVKRLADIESWSSQRVKHELAQFKAYNEVPKSTLRSKLRLGKIGLRAFSPRDEFVKADPARTNQVTTPPETSKPAGTVKRSIRWAAPIVATAALLALIHGNSDRSGPEDNRTAPPMPMSSNTAPQLPSTTPTYGPRIGSRPEQPTPPKNPGSTLPIQPDQSIITAIPLVIMQDGTVWQTLRNDLGRAPTNPEMEQIFAANEHTVGPDHLDLNWDTAKHLSDGYQFHDIYNPDYVARHAAK